MTYSIGFRAPDAVTTFESFALEIERLGANVPRYSDPELELNRHKAEITDLEIARFRALAVELFEQSPELWRDAVGKMLSDSAVGQDSENEQPVYVSDLQSRAWIRHPETRLFYHLTEESIQPRNRFSCTAMDVCTNCRVARKPSNCCNNSVPGANGRRSLSISASTSRRSKTCWSSSLLIQRYCRLKNKYKYYKCLWKIVQVYY